MKDNCSATESCPIGLEAQIKQQLDETKSAMTNEIGKLDFELVELKNAVRELKAISSRLFAAIDKLTEP
jgi:hypothetical protein